VLRNVVSMTLISHLVCRLMAPSTFLFFGYVLFVYVPTLRHRPDGGSPSGLRVDRYFFTSFASRRLCGWGPFFFFETEAFYSQGAVFQQGACVSCVVYFWREDLQDCRILDWEICPVPGCATPAGSLISVPRQVVRFHAGFSTMFRLRTTKPTVGLQVWLSPPFSSGLRVFSPLMFLLERLLEDKR